METKYTKEYNDRCRNKTDQISLREELSGVIQNHPILRQKEYFEFTFQTNTKRLSVLDVINLYKKR